MISVLQSSGNIYIENNVKSTLVARYGVVEKGNLMCRVRTLLKFVM